MRDRKHELRPDFAEKHTFYIDGFPDFTRQNLAILEHLIRACPCVTVSMNCDQIGSPLLAFEKAGQTAQELYRCAARAGVQVEVEVVSPRPSALEPVRQALFQGPIRKGSAQAHLSVSQAESAYQACLDAAKQVLALVQQGCRYRDIQACLDAAKQVLALVQQGCRYRDITLVCADMDQYLPLAELIFHRFHIPLYRSGTEEILQESVISTVLTALDAALSGFDQRTMLRYLRSALSCIVPARRRFCRKVSSARY